jgi:hypothetical protein
MELQSAQFIGWFGKARSSFGLVDSPQRHPVLLLVGAQTGNSLSVCAAGHSLEIAD